MKNLYRFCLVLPLLFIMINSSTFAGDRTVLVERFTSSTCGPCAQNNPTMDAFLSSQDPSKVTSIAYHMNWPAPGNDPMFLHNQNDNNGRRSYYGVNAIPQGQLDGPTNVGLPYSQSTLQALANGRLAILSPVTIIVQDSTYGDSVLVRATIYCETLLSDASATVHFAVMERLIHYTSPPGTNGETNFTDVMRKMLPSSSGTNITLLPGHTNILEYRYKIDPVWNAAQLKNMVFVQNNGTKEIYNSALKTEDFNLLTSLGYGIVNQGQSQNHNYSIQVPVVKSGYNTPVNFSAQVEPSTAGISISFPGGSTLSNFPGQVGLNVSSTASVPSGVYKIIVTASNSLADTHKIVVNYLVGKSWVTMGVNKPQVLYKVDNSTYGGTKLFEWDINSNHTIEAITPQLFGNTRYAFVNWLDGDTNISRNVNITPAQSDYIINYKTQFKVTTAVNPGGIPATVNGGNQFYDSNSTNSISITPTQLTFNGKQYFFQRWLGGGAGSYSGPNSSFNLTLSNPVNQIAIYDTINTGINNYSSEIPDKFDLHQNYPNPFNPSTSIRFDIPQPGAVKLVVYNELGKQVAVLQDGFMSYGRYEVQWDASALSSGIYYYSLTAESGFKAIKKLVLLK